MGDKISACLNKMVLRLREAAVRRRVTFNQILFIALLVFLAHPRNRFFFIMGFIPALTGALLRVWAKGTLVREAKDLITIGPYRFVRHPMYLGTLLEVLGLCISCFNFSNFFSWLLLVLILLGYFGFVYKETMLLEEDELYDRYGRAWEDYSLRTPTLLPEWTALKTLRWRDLKSFEFSRFETSKEWNNFLAFLGVALLLWFKLVYRL